MGGHRYHAFAPLSPRSTRQVLILALVAGLISASSAEGQPPVASPPETPVFDQFTNYQAASEAPSYNEAAASDATQALAPYKSATVSAPPPAVSSAIRRPTRNLPSGGSGPQSLGTVPDVPVPPSLLAMPMELPNSPAQHFAEMADSELSGPVTPVQLANYQPSLSEGGGQDALNSLNRRVRSLEEEVQRSGQAAKRQARVAGGEGGFEHNLFGRIQADTVTFGQSPENIKQVGHAVNGTDFRRARIGMQGTGYDVYFYRFEVDFASPDQVIALVPRITDAYAEIRQLPMGTLRMGEFRVPLGSERLMSANDLTFIERGLPQAFNPARQLGIMLFNSTENYFFSWYSDISTWKATDEAEQSGKSGRFDYTQRVVFLPWYDQPSNGRYMFHFGGAYQWQNVRNQIVSYSTTPEAVLYTGTTKEILPNFISTGNITARDVQIAQVEASTVLGPLSFQAEYYGTWVDPTGGSGTPFFFHGAYAYVSYFLTGEHRIWSRDQGYYTSVTPFTNFFRVRGGEGNVVQGWGAWELAARFSTMNLSDRSVQGGRLNDVTLGVNWYLTRQMKVMANYIYAMNNVGNAPSYANIVETRCQVVW